MSTDRLSRRRLLGSVLAGLTAWLCPRPARTATAPRRPPAADLRERSECDSAYSYTYDGMSGFVRVEEYSTLPLPLAPLAEDTRGPIATYTYSYNGDGQG